MINTPLEAKVCIIGDSDVGKTSLSTRFCHDEFNLNSTPTIGASFLQKRVPVDNNTNEVNLQIWDTAGQERFRSMAPMYYRGAKAAICVFDVTNHESYERILGWVRDLKSHADPKCVICVAANKCDKSPSFDVEACEEYAKSIDAIYYKTSALTGENVKNIFNALSQRVYEVYSVKRPASGLTSSGRRLDDSEETRTIKHEPSCC